MLWLVIGGITALAIIVFYGKDERAVREHKEELEKQKTERVTAERRQK
jgi:cytochrome c-type biogenesis protein CcmH/NrfF